MSSSVDNIEVPQWKKELIARLRSQNKRTATAVGTVGRQEQLRSGPPQVQVGRAVQQPNHSHSNETVAVAAAVAKECECSSAGKCESVHAAKMVQERIWALEAPCKNGICGKNSDSDSSEDLRYGPGIVNKLRNKYLSLAQRESRTQVRASILPMRKAASLENILDDEVPIVTAAPPVNRLFQSRLNGSNDTAKNVPNRYRNASRGSSDLKRARSVETISRSDVTNEDNNARPKRESLHEDMLITATDGSAKPTKNIPDSNNKLETPSYTPRVNRPKRIAPIMNEREKPPVDVVKQAKLIFERRPEQRTRPPQQTGDVAAKVATYKSIIVQAKAAKKPPIKLKPLALSIEKFKIRGTKTKTVQTDEPLKVFEMTAQKTVEKPTPLPSPIPDVSRIETKSPSDENNSKNTSLSETPDLIMTSSPLPALTSPSFRISATENFIIEEKRHSNLTHANKQSINEPTADTTQTSSEEEKKSNGETANIPNNSMTFNFANTNKTKNNHPVVSNNKSPTSNAQPLLLQPLKLEINGVNNADGKKFTKNEVISPILVSSPKANLTNLEIEKNLINTAKTLEQSPPAPPLSPKNCVNKTFSNDDVSKIKVPKVKKPQRELENNSVVFKFTDRKDVPDYVQNDGIKRVAKIEKPKVGEGGIILLPGASIDESFTDEDEEILRSLEGPPSPCDVTFINDNILIDGKSSLSQKMKKAKMKISFVEAGPEIYEYPSESSLLIEDLPSPASPAQIRNSVPSVTGSPSLGNYTPKSTEDFQPGVTRSVQSIPTKTEPESADSSNELILQEVEKPISFSTGTNSDILF